jgi:2-aminoethylphosphonate dioxygenase
MTRSLTPGELDTFRRKGYITLRGIFNPDEAAIWASECKRLLGSGVAHENNLRTHPYYVTKTMWLVDRMDPVVDISGVFKKLSTDERLLVLVRQIFDDDALLFKDRLIYKMLGVVGYPIHQDYSWWQEFPQDLVNVTIAIDGADADNGALELFPYHHKLLSTPGEMRHMNNVEAGQIDYTSGELMITEPGDVVIFHCMTPHRSGPNVSNRLRRQLYLTYSAARHGDLYQRQIELMKEGKSSRRFDENRKAQLFLR